MSRIENTCFFKIYGCNSNVPVFSNMKAAIIPNVVTYNVVNREEGNLSLYFSKRLHVKVNFHLIHLLLIFPKFLATLTGCHIKKNKFF